MLDVGAALSVPVDKLPIQDPLEPNDNLVWVNGRAFGKPAAPLWSGGKAKRISGLLDVQEDPVDAYRIVDPGRQDGEALGDPALRRPVAGGLPLRRRSRSTTRTRGSRSSTSRGSKKTERVTVRNPGTKKRSYYVAVRPQGSSRYQEREYTLRVG